MSNLPTGLEQILKNELYHRRDVKEVNPALLRLNVNVSDTFRVFYGEYEGPFWEEHVPFELLDLVEDKKNIESYTMMVRKEHGFPNQFLVLSEMSANAILVLDISTDKVYNVNFEGGDELFLKGELEARWLTFHEFLKEYIGC